MIQRHFDDTVQVNVFLEEERYVSEKKKKWNVWDWCEIEWVIAKKSSEVSKKPDYCRRE